MYSLVRSRDGAGDSGTLSEAFQYQEGMQGRINVRTHSRPKKGFAIRVGSPFARTMLYQDYWDTTYVKEILEESDTMVRFLTENGSEYTWRCS